MKTNKILAFSVAAMLAVTSVVLLVTKENGGAQTIDAGSGVAAIGGHFSLTNQDKEKTDDSQFLGKYMLVFFGFTHCPDICPVTMATVTQVMEGLGDKADMVAPIFISVDPKRDTPEQLKTFLANFDKRIVGLTGTKEEIEAVAANYKAFYSEVATEAPKEDPHAHHKKEHDEHAHHKEENYMVDHSAFIYVMDKKGVYIAHFPYDVAPEELTKKLQELVSNP